MLLARPSERLMKAEDACGSAKAQIVPLLPCYIANMGSGSCLMGSHSLLHGRNARPALSLCCANTGAAGTCILHSPFWMQPALDWLVQESAHHQRELLGPSIRQSAVWCVISQSVCLCSTGSGSMWRLLQPQQQWAVSSTSLREQPGRVLSALPHPLASPSCALPSSDDLFRDKEGAYAPWDAYGQSKVGCRFCWLPASLELGFFPLNHTSTEGSGHASTPPLPPCHARHSFRASVSPQPLSTNPHLPHKPAQLANLYFTYELARRLQGSPQVTVNALHPGVVKTELGRYMIDASNQWWVPPTIMPGRGACRVACCGSQDGHLLRVHAGGAATLGPSSGGG